VSADDSRLHALREFERKLDVTFPPAMLTYFAFGFYKDGDISTATFRWEPIAEVFEKLNLLVMQAGDALDRAMCARQLAVVRSYLKKRRGAH